MWKMLYLIYGNKFYIQRVFIIIELGNGHQDSTMQLRYTGNDNYGIIIINSKNVILENTMLKLTDAYYISWKQLETSDTQYIV